MPWEKVLYPELRDPEHAIGYVDACAEEYTPNLVALALCDVIKANQDRPFVAYQVVCAYSSHLAIEDIHQIGDVLKGFESIHQEYLSDLYWWLHLLEKTLLHGGVKQFQLKAELLPGNMPAQFKVLPEYQQWEKHRAGNNL